MRPWIVLALFVVSLAPAAHAQEPSTSETEVERIKEHDAHTLRFLRDNQVFLRGQLDQLRTKIHWRESDAGRLTARQEWLRGLGVELAAAQDSLAREDAELSQLTLLERIEDLSKIERQLDRLEEQLDQQRARLTAIESDYVGRQETALAILATGLPFDDARAIVVDAINGDLVRVHLDADARDALQTGAIATLLHDFVEPRELNLHLSLERADGSIVPIGELRVEPVRDRLTFVQVALDAKTGDDGLMAAVTWQR